MNVITQEAISVIVNHNPDMQTCAFEGCTKIIFGPCVMARVTEEGSKGKKTKEWILCSPQCYVGFDKWFEYMYLEWAGEDHIATIDGGMPEEWDSE